jgi:hypothetical protein
MALLFVARLPEAAARQLATLLAWLTECELATREELASRKSTPKRDLHRHGEICTLAVRQCFELGLRPGVLGLRGHPCSRLDEELKRLSDETARRGGQPAPRDG